MSKDQFDKLVTIVDGHHVEVITKIEDVKADVEEIKADVKDLKDATPGVPKGWYPTAG